MLFPYFKSIRTQLSTVANLKQTSWYNNNFEVDNLIVQNGEALVQFTKPLETDYQSKQSKSGLLTIAIHFVSKIIFPTSGEVPDAAIEAHETIANDIAGKLQGFEMVNDTADKISKHMREQTWQHNHNIRGWAVTTIIFEAKALFND